MAFNTGQRELVMGSDVQNGASGAANAVTCTITASEPGSFDMERAVFGIMGDDANIQGADFTNQGMVTSILVQNSIELIRGRNNPAAPTSAFTGTRGIASAIPLGKFALQTGDTIAATISTGGCAVAWSAPVAAPDLPRNSRGASTPLPAWQPTYAASPLTNIATAGAPGTGTAGNLTITFDEDGVMDLTSLHLGGINETGNIGNGTYKDGLGGCNVSSIQLPSSNVVLVGQNNPASPATMWAPGRSYTWANFGAYAVSAGSTLVVTVNNFLPDDVDVSAGLRFFPKGGPAIRG